jgi:hypothetical protein
MTTLVYHDNILAADRRVKYFDYALGKLKEAHCVHCNTKSETITISDDKITLLDGIVLDGDSVLAVACSGSAIHTDKLIKLMKKGYSPELIIELADGMSTEWMEAFTVIFVCKESVRVLDYWGGNANWKVHSRGATIVQGSGASAALLSIKKMKATAWQSIQYAAIGDDCTGNGAVYVDFNQPVLNKQIVETEEVIEC